MSSASDSKRSGRSASGVWPWPWSSMAITRRRLARRAHSGASAPAAPNPPWATISGTPPPPRASQYIRVAPIATSPVSTV